MFPYKDEKIVNAISYIAIKHKEKTKQFLFQTSLYKYLAFIDFESTKETGEPVTGLIYKAMERGPVPKEIYSEGNYQSTELYKFVKNDNNVQIIPTKQLPDLNFFSEYEIQLMDKYLDIFAESWIKSSHMSDASHEEIFAWKRTYKKEPNAEIEYKNHFPGNLQEKDVAKLNLSQEHFLLFSKFTDVK